MATFEELSNLAAGDEVSIDFVELWRGKYGGEISEHIELALDGYLRISPSEEDGYDPYEDPYVDLYTDAGPVACDGEVCDVIAVDIPDETIVLRSRDYEAPFSLAFDDAIWCMTW